MYKITRKKLIIKKTKNTKKLKKKNSHPTCWNFVIFFLNDGFD